MTEENQKTFQNCWAMLEDKPTSSDSIDLADKTCFLLQITSFCLFLCVKVWHNYGMFSEGPSAVGVSVSIHLMFTTI